VVDLVPAPSQALTFAKIQRSLDSAGESKVVENLLGDALNDPKMASAIAPLVKRSAAIAVFGDPKSKAKTQPIVGLIAVSDAEKTEKALIQTLKPVSNANGTYFKAKNDFCFRVAGGYLEAAGDPNLFARLDRVQSGAAKAITSVPSFAKARASLTPESNIKGFFSDKGRWVTVSGTVKDAGVQFLAKGVQPGGMGLALQPLAPSLLHKLPSGPYGLISVAQLAKIFNPSGKGGDANSKALTSALRGDAVIALYPTVGKTRKGLGALIMLDGANDADPAHAFKLLEKSMSKQFADGQPLFSKPKRVGSAMVGELTGPLKGALKGASKSASSAVKGDLLSDLTVAYATEGRTLIVATSKQLLNRAIAANQGKGASLASDPAYSRARSAVTNGSQLLIAASLHRIAEGIMNSAAKKDDTIKQIEQGFAAFSNGDQTFDINGGFKPNGAWRAEIFVPVNYAKLGSSISQAAQALHSDGLSADR
jgi:hypothetical protein